MMIDILPRFGDVMATMKRAPGELLLSGQVKPEGGKKAFAWMIWEHGWQGPPQIRQLIKPVAAPANQGRL